MPLSVLESAFNPADPVDATADVSFGVARTPTDGTVLVYATVRVSSDGNPGQVTVSVDGAQRAEAWIDVDAGGLTGTPNNHARETITFLVQDGSSYTLANALDPAAANAIVLVEEQPV